ncbi:MAG TPA: hypothetical protein VFQ53_34700 [Kofleriaceae bacterium]|nr:hypothetical protein [Kofleriaceae bacterium]
MTRFGVLAIVIASLAHPASADPIRLRADALATTASPAGLLVLEADSEVRSGLDAEAVVWMAGNTALDDGASGDVLVIALRGRTESGRASGQVGRFVSTLGALRPIHVDGASARLRLPSRFDLEAVAGMPVQTGLTMSRSWDWYVGGRAARRLGEWGSVGLAYGQRRDDGLRSSEELATDAGFTITQRDDVGARAAYDLVHGGIAEIAVTGSHRTKSLRTDVYATHREASHLLPATSLFSVLGDVPSERAGTTLTWKAAPRLDLIADGGVRYIDELGLELVGRARLRLDDAGKSALTGEVRRSGVGDDQWTGLRGAARIALPYALTASTELELVIPDVDRDTGRVWPWGLAALGWERADWQAAVAVEASASPEYRSRFDVLAQLGRRWGSK